MKRKAPPTSAVAAALFALVSLSSLGGCAASESKNAEYPQSGGGYAQAGYPAPAPPADSDGVRNEVRQDVARERVVLGSASDTEETAVKTADAAPARPAAGFAGSYTPNGAGPAPVQPAAPPPPPPPPRPAEKKTDPTAEPAPTRDLVIYTARFTMAVYLVDQGLSAVEKIARDNGGYLGQKSDREITIRIPRGRFEPTLAAINQVGDVIHRDIQAQDVTDEHVDLEIRIKNARAMQRRLTDLLTKASVKDALEIEKELHRVTEELERLEGKMKVLKDKIAFSTITVSFTPRGSTLQSARVRLPFPWLSGLNLPSLLSLHEEK